MRLLASNNAILALRNVITQSSLTTSDLNTLAMNTHFSSVFLLGSISERADLLYCLVAASSPTQSLSPNTPAFSCSDIRDIRILFSISLSSSTLVSIL